MHKNLSLKRINDVGSWLSSTPPAKVILDPGILFSALHAIAFSGSSSHLIQGLGFASLALTASVSIVRNFLPNINQKIAQKLNPFLERAGQPKIDSNGFPLYANGAVLSVIAATSFYVGDLTSASISTSYAISNMGKGAAISGAWTLEDVGKKSFSMAAQIMPTKRSKARIRMLAKNPPNFLKNSIYLPELWASAGAFSYGLLYSTGLLTAIGALASSVSVVAAALNNGSFRRPYNIKIPVFGQVTALSNWKERPASDQVISRRFMKYASGVYALGALGAGNVAPAMGHGFAAAGNHILETGDRENQMKMIKKLEA